VNAADFMIIFVDRLAPTLDTYEQAIYLYVYRHSRLLGQDEAVIGFKSARRKLAFGVGKQGTPPSEAVVYSKLRSLEKKGCLKIITSERTGTRLKLFLPSEIPGLIADQPPSSPAPSLDTLDFFSTPEHRRAILRREDHRCFYCLRKVDDDTYVIEHVVSRPTGDNTYRNLVAACRQCNNRKGSMDATDYLRLLYRDSLLDKSEFDTRCSQLELLRSGELRPVLDGAL